MGEGVTLLCGLVFSLNTSDLLGQPHSPIVLTLDIYHLDIFTIMHLLPVYVPQRHDP